MLKEGVEHYISNVKTRFFFLKVDGHCIPISVNEKEYENAYVTSNYYAIAHVQHKVSIFVRPFVRGAGLLLKGIEANRVVIVNNWLLSGALYPQLSGEQLEAVTRFLEERFPSHLVMFRGLTDREHVGIIDGLEDLGYHKFFARKVHYFDPEEKRGKRAAYHLRRDRRLMESAGYVVTTRVDVRRFLELYRSIYLEKHTQYAPRYTEAFLQRAIESGFLQMRTIERKGEIVGVFGYCVEGGAMIAPFFGFDAQSERRTEVYRILMLTLIEEAEKLGALLNDGSGGETAKRFRGLKEFNEYALIYTRHLRWHKRLFWGISNKAANLF